ncbi:MAG: HlyD family type I secretion periplasmic adaptor subunit [Pseudomonadota bacterium]
MAKQTAISKQNAIAGDGVSSLLSAKWARLVGFTSLVLLLGGFGVWASTAPLAGAVIVDGQVVASGRNLPIQHLEGGIIEEVLVKEGERVAAGQTIMVIDDTSARALLRRLRKQAVGLNAELNRLIAERDRDENVSFPPELLEEATAIGAADVFEEQISEFTARSRRVSSEKNILEKRLAAQAEAVAGFESRMTALGEQVEIIGDEIDRKLGLLEDGLTNRSEYTELLRARAELVGQQGALAAQIESTRTQLLQSEEEIIRLERNLIETASVRINEIRRQLQDVDEQTEVARDTLTRTRVRAQADGRIIQLAVRISGTVIRPGDLLATILPAQKDLIIDGQMSVADIDLVTEGQSANLQFIALNQRVTPEVPAEVIFISPDAINDEATGIPYYAVRLRPTELPPEVRDEDIFPGMPVSALISTSERTFFEYIARPVTDSFRLAFREE